MRKNFNQRVAKLFAESKISLTKILIIVLGLVLIHTAIIYSIQIHYQNRAYKNEVRNTLLSMLRIGNHYYSDVNSEPDGIVFRKQYDPENQANTYNIIFQKIPGAVLIDKHFVDHQQLKQLENKLFRDHSLALTSRFPGKQHEWFTLYVQLKHSDEMYILLTLNIIVHLATIALLIFLLYITRYIFPKIIFDHASRGLKGKKVLSTLPEDMLQKLSMLRGQVDRLVHEKTFVMASMSHDMRNSLAKLQLLVHFVKEKDAADKMTAELNEIQMIIDSSLAFSEGGTKTKVESFPIYDYLNDLHAFFQRRGYQFSFTMSVSKNTKIQGYPALLKRAITNVVNNAAKYANSYEISCEETNRHVLIKIEDDGPGVSDAQLSKINTPYQRSVEAIESNIEGYGLGLAITKASVEFHGGKLSYQNLKPQGFEVIISLPVDG